MKSFLLTTAAIVVMVSLVPLSAWAARGRWQDAWTAAKAYGFILCLLIGIPALIGAVVGFISFASQ